ncbi:MAG: gluconokinase [Actinobacteria bacterium]|nr:gluconokinase [Actinomycetota bacterium]
MTRVLAIDVGSSSVRARLYDESGRVLSGDSAQRRWEASRGRDGRVEFDPGELVAATRGAIEDALEPDDRYDAVGCSCFWHSFMALDRGGRPLTPLLTWGDTRSVDHAEHLARRLDGDAVHARTGAPLHPSFWPAKLAWLRETSPEVFTRAARFVGLGEYLLQELAGEARASVSMASATGLLDVHTLAWDGELLEALGLEPERLPELGGEPVGSGPAWYPADGDGATSNVGSGCLTRERAALMMGTSGAFRTAYEAEDARPRPGLFLYRIDERRLVEGGSLSDGGNLVSWLERTLKLPDEPGLEGRVPGEHGLTFLPLLGGERATGWNGRARGAVAGLSLATTPEDVYQAALEGIALRVADIAERMPEVREVVATGKALLSQPAWIQVLADVLALPVTASAEPEASSLGVVNLTLERLGEEPAPTPLGRTFEPREERVEAYRSAREEQRNLYRGVT